MAERVVLHVGAPKSGTTFLQTVLWENRERLASAQVLVPGRRPFELIRAVKAVRTGERNDATAGSPGKAWRRIVAQVQSWPGTAVLSNEWFSLASQERAAEALHDFAPAEVHVVFTARAAVHQVPAAWQETLKLGRSQPLGSFIERLDRPGQRWSWWTLDASAVLARWGASLPPDRVHVVTVPPRGSDPQLLWRRFAQVCGIDPDTCDTAVAVTNESLGAESARLLQELGPGLREAVGAEDDHWSASYRWLRRFVGHELLVPRGGSRIALRPDELRLLREHGTRSAAAVGAAGYDVVGDLADLEQTIEGLGSRHPDDVDDAELLQAAGALSAQLLRCLRDQTLRAERAEARLLALESDSSDGSDDGSGTQDALEEGARTDAP